MRKIILTAFLICSSSLVYSQSDVKTGWNFGALPSVAFDTDLGFQYGALTNIYYYGDGTTYPEYIHSIYLEAAYTTKNNGIFRFSYDSKKLIPDHQITFDIAYTPDEMCDFTGFNGYQSVFNRDWADDESSDYRSRAFYKFKRNLLRINADIKGNINGPFKWNAGIGLLDYSVGSVNIDRLNKGKDDKDKLPAIDGIFEKYRSWGLIDADETKGGLFPYIRGGVTYDTRNRTAAPSKGIWSDMFLTYTAAFGDQSKYNSLKLNANFCQYIPVYGQDVVFAYRLSTQLSLAGSTPFYMSSFQNNLFMKRVMYEGLGGASSLRGVMRNRAISDGFAMANIEFRIKLAKFDIGKQHYYVAVNPLLDMGAILQPFSLDEQSVRNAVSNDGENVDDYFDFNRSVIYKPHFSGGMGLKIAMNENFILSVDWATPFDKQDASKTSNMYIKMGYLF